MTTFVGFLIGIGAGFSAGWAFSVIPWFGLVYAIILGVSFAAGVDTYIKHEARKR